MIKGSPSPQRAFSIFSIYLPKYAMNPEELISFIEKHFNTEPSYLWEKFPSYTVFKHSKNNKWFGILMDVPGTKLGLKTSERINILNVKLKSAQIDFLNSENILPAYHMNKEHWVSIIIDKTSEQQISDLLSESFKLTS